MAPFNPQIQPSQDPNWTGISRPISDLPGDKSKALAISTATDALDTGVRVAENIDQDVIKEKTRAGVEALRDATTLAYETTRGALIQGQQPPAAAANVAGLGILKTAQNNADVPEALQSGLDRAQDLATARTQGTLRANDTLYTGALNSLAKQLRSEYPGHKDFIDEQIARISGKNPANAYMDNLLTDISRLATGTDSTEKKLMGKAWENFGDPAVNMALKAYQAGIPGAKENLWKAVTGAEAEKLSHTQTMNNFQEGEAAGKVDTSQVRYQAQQSAQRTVFRNFNGVVDTVLSPSLVQQLITENQQGKITSMSPDQWENLAQHVESMKNITLDQIKSNFNQTGISRRFAANGLTGDEKSIIDNEMQFFDRTIAAIRDPNKGMFFEMQRRAKGLQDNTTYQALSDPTIGPTLQKFKVLQDTAGPAWANMAGMVTLQKGYLGPMQNFFGDATARAAVPDDIRKDGIAKSLTSDIIAAKKQASQGTKFDPRLYDDLVKNVDLIEQSTKLGGPQAHDTAKEVAKYMFDPNRNADFVKQWSRDFKDTNGVDHKGYFAYYDLMTRPKVVDAVYGLKDTETSNMFHNWNEHQFRQLFGNEVQALNKIQGDTANPATIEWNTNTNSMTLKFANKPKDTVDQNYQSWAQDSVTRLNKGLGNLGYMFKKENQDPSEGIFTTLMQLSYQPKEGLSGQLPKMVIDAINRSQFQPSEEERLRHTFEKLGK